MSPILTSFRSSVTIRNASRKNAYQIRSLAVTVLSEEEVTVETFRKENQKSVLYFTAKWCPPCKAIAPIYSALSDKHPTIAFGKIDVDGYADAAAEADITAVPTFMIYNGEELVDTLKGANAEKLEEMLLKVK